MRRGYASCPVTFFTSFLPQIADIKCNRQILVNSGGSPKINPRATGWKALQSRDHGSFIIPITAWTNKEGKDAAADDDVDSGEQAFSFETGHFGSSVV